MTDRVSAAALFRDRLQGRRLIEGWIEGPMAEAADLRGINTLMLDFYDDPQFVRDLFDFVLELELRFAKAQVDAGAESIGIGDAAVVPLQDVLGEGTEARMNLPGRPGGNWRWRFLRDAVDLHQDAQQLTAHRSQTCPCHQP